jgi:hypothetical protein
MSRVPDPTAKGKERARFWADLRALSRPLLTYWLLMGVSLGVFCAAILRFNHAGKDFMALATIAASVVVATIVGQATAIARIRGWVVGLVVAVLWVLGGLFSAIMAASAGPLAIFIFLFVFLFPFFAAGGRYSLRAGRAFAGVWVPLMFVAGTVITVAEGTGRAKAWHAGDKYAIWDVATLGLFTVVLILILIFLVQREIHRLHLWRTASKAPRAVQADVKHTRGAMALSFRGWLLLILIGLLTTVAVAAISPYLFRTGDRDGGSGSGTQSVEPSDDPGTKKSDPSGDPIDLDELEKLMEKYGPLAQRAGSILGMLLMVLMLILLGLLVGWRPGKRLWTVQHGHRPMFKVSASGQIRNSWRLVEIALGDLGVQARPNEPAQQLYRRSLTALQGLRAGGAEVSELGQAAAIRDRVTYGLGIGSEDVALMQRVARWAYRTVWDRQGDWAQIKAMYRGLG